MLRVLAKAQKPAMRRTIMMKGLDECVENEGIAEDLRRVGLVRVHPHVHLGFYTSRTGHTRRNLNI